MWLLALEAGIALGLFLFIGWWTIGPVHRRERQELERLREEQRQREASPPDAP